MDSQDSLDSPDSPDSKTVTIVGVGRLGGALAIALSRSGYQIESLALPNPKNALLVREQIAAPAQVLSIEQLDRLTPSETVLITTPDPQIQSVAEQLAALPQFTGRSTVFLHTSGSLSSDVLSVLRDQSYAIGSLHPLVSISDAIRGASAFQNAFFCIEGDERARQTCDQIVQDLGGQSFAIDAKHKALYHAAAVITSGHTVALFDLAVELLADCGLESEQARTVLVPLLESTIDNLRMQPTIAKALTGTFARADLAALQRHLAVLPTTEADEIYRALGKRALKLAAEAGADLEALQEMNALLKNNFV